ncbi:MAG: DegT/DnrJ/EryC1/StrS family aminotransferase [Prevotella sp.]|jgi:dTDP-4-amino-4,6-dideoxygalactose transaminase|nr:DegT/DnrJ/EryC1/StrS family aminotransferase [Prevotella sp.]
MIKYLDLKRINAPYEHAADEVLCSGWYLRGETTRHFEQHYAEYIGTKHCIGCANGLDALTLILRAYKELGIIHEGDEVIVPANTYIASILAVTENRLTPVLVEPDINTLQIDDTLIEQAITLRTRAIMIVHLYGRCAYTDRIGEICQRHGMKLIEDNAQAHGCMFATQLHTGALGDAAGHSFYPTKNLGAFGDAGAVTTDDDELAEVVRALGNYGSAEKYIFERIGRNSRIDELQAAILDAKLAHLDADNARRKAIATTYINQVKNPLIRLPRPSDGRDSVWHIFPVLCSRRDELQQYLRDHGVETQIHYPIPPHKQKCYADWNSLSLPITEQIHAQELSIPCHPAMTLKEASIVADLLNLFQ